MNYRLLAPYYLTNVQIDGNHSVEIDGIKIVIQREKDTTSTRVLVVAPIEIPPEIEEILDEAFANTDRPAKMPPDVLEFLSTATKKASDISKIIKDWFCYRVDQSLQDIELCLHRGFQLQSKAHNKSIEFTDRYKIQIVAQNNSWILDDKDMLSLASFISSKHVEPVYWKLLRSVWSERYQAESSSLLIAFNALEVSVKHWFAHCYVASEWLVFNIPSPPLANIMSRIQDDKSLAPEKKLPADEYDRDKIKVITKLRNDLAHKAELTTSDVNGRYVSYIGLLIARIDAIVNGNNRETFISFAKSCTEKTEDKSGGITFRGSVT